MATFVYVLCAVTSLLCTWMLASAYRRSKHRFLLWSAACFGGFFLNNVLLIIDLRLIPETDLSIIRSLPVLAGLVLLIYGLIWEADR